MHTKRAAKKSGKLRKLRRGFILLVLLIAIVVLVIYTLNSVGPVIVSVSEARIRALTTSAVNSAIFEVMTEPTKYSELITIQKDDAGNITFDRGKRHSHQQPCARNGKTDGNLHGGNRRTGN